MDKKSLQVIVFSFVMAAILIYVGYRFGTEEEITPCSPGGFPGSCYAINQKACEMVWESATKICEGFIQKAQLPPGRLTGPIMTKCQSVVLDNTFGGSRKGTPECQNLSEELKEWSARNDFK
jgi:hypothetical protein